MVIAIGRIHIQKQSVVTPSPPPPHGDHCVRSLQIIIQHTTTRNKPALCLSINSRSMYQHLRNTENMAMWLSPLCELQLWCSDYGQWVPGPVDWSGVALQLGPMIWRQILQVPFIGPCPSPTFAFGFVATWTVSCGGVSAPLGFKSAVEHTEKTGQHGYHV